MSDTGMGVALKAVQDGDDVSATMERLIQYCELREPDDAETWNAIRAIDFAADCDGITLTLSKQLSSGKIGAEYTGFYFGLDGLNMPRGKGIELGCSTQYKGAEDIEWVYHCEIYPGNIQSEALAEMYRHLSCASLGDLVLCLGYLGLALRKAFDRIEPGIALGGAGERSIVWGFHDGDLFRLGSVKAAGFAVDFEPFALKLMAESEPTRTAKKKLKRGSLPTTRGGWLRWAAEEAKLLDLDERRKAMETILRKVSGNSKECLDLIEMALESTEGARANHRFIIFKSAASIFFAAGERERSIEMLGQAEKELESIDPVIRDIYAMDVEYLKRELGLLPPRKLSAKKQLEQRNATEQMFPDYKIKRIWKDGRLDEERSLVKEELLANFLEGSGSCNLHHELKKIRDVLNVQWELPDRAGFSESVKLTIPVLLNWAGSSEREACRILQDVAMLLYRIGDRAGTEAALTDALELAKKENNPKRSKMGGVALCYEWIGNHGRAIELAKQHTDPGNRREILAILYGRGGNAEELGKLFGGLKSDITRIDLAMTIVDECFSEASNS